ncbi:copper resistance protein A, partial [Bordetella hinzii CA90 BAL1384]|uniref:copper resistance system multicopper oxidase n=1 Tax=Bordetella hinzii TaxID=103855 RepID=UPI00045B7820
SAPTATNSWSKARAKKPRAAPPHGTEFHLDIGETPVNFTGRPRIATTVNGSVPAPVLHWREGDEVTLHVRNRLAESTSIHWHGILLPTGMDGVPGLSFPGIAPGETFTYRFRLRQSGTYWYHSHSGFQEQTGLYGAIVVQPRRRDPVASERDYTVLLSDWTDEDPMQVFHKLKAMPDYYNNIQPSLQSLRRDARRMGWREALSERLMWEQMRMNPTDLADVSGATYTYLLNGRTPAGNWTGLFTPGERVRLRLINGSAMSYFDVRLPGLKMTVVSADGQDVRPVTVDELRIGVAETYDVIVQPKEARAYTLFAQSIDRSGYARGTLAPRAGMQAEVPAVDEVQVLSMQDMGMDHAAMGHGAAPAMDHGQMDHGAMNHAPAGGGMIAAAHAHAAGDGVANSMVPDMISTRLDDPGPGLRGNGRRVLTYADLYSIIEPADNRPPSREIELHLTGNMDRYMWSFNGKTFTEAEPIVLKHGERVRFVLVNDTMMLHPIHLHGLWSDLESPEGRFQVRKHTITVLPAQRISYRVSADARGNWAYHCHLLYHMEAGMFRAVVVE